MYFFVIYIFSGLRFEPTVALDKVVKSNVGLEGKYEEIKKVMEEAPNEVDVKPMSKFRKDTRIEKY